MTINYRPFVRTIRRCVEVGTQEASIPPSSMSTKESFAEGATAYVASDSAANRAVIAYEEKKRDPKTEPSLSMNATP